MKIAFTATGPTWESLVDPRFGRTEYIVLFDEEIDLITVVDNRSVSNEAHGAGTATAQKMYELKPDILITGNGPGDTAAQALKHLKMRIFVDAHDMTLAKAYDAYTKGKLREI